MKKYTGFIALLVIWAMLAGGCASPAAPTEAPTAAPTEASTAAPTEASTAAPTEAPTDPPATVPSTEPPVDSLESVRETMRDMGKRFAVIYFGNDEMADPELVVEETAVRWPFLREITQDQRVGQTGPLICVIPLDQDALVAVSTGYWDVENQQYIYDNMCYSSSSGDPILVRCDSLWMPVTQVYIGGADDDLFWYPQLDSNDRLMPLPDETGENAFLDLTDYQAMPQAPTPEEMVGVWTLAWTEVEGDRNEAEPGRQTMVITVDDAGGLWISYSDTEFPESDYLDKALTVVPDGLYDGCGNDRWSAKVDHVGVGGMEYAVALLEDGTLLVQNYWEMDGVPMVSYGWYKRVDVS